MGNSDRARARVNKLWIDEVATAVITSSPSCSTAEFVFNVDVQHQAEDIALVQNMGFEVDEDNGLAPENAPVNNAHHPINGGNLFDEQEWGWNGHLP